MPSLLGGCIGRGRIRHLGLAACVCSPVKSCPRTKRGGPLAGGGHEPLREEELDTPLWSVTPLPIPLAVAGSGSGVGLPFRFANQYLLICTLRWELWEGLTLTPASGDADLSFPREQRTVPAGGREAKTEGKTSAPLVPFSLSPSCGKT